MSSKTIPETPNGHHRPRLPKQTPRTARSNAGTAGITHVRPEIAAEMDGEVSIVPLASFIEAYLPPKPDDKVVDGFVTQAVKSRLMHRTGKKLRFAKFMTTPTAGKGLEDELYAPLEDIGKAVAAFEGWRDHTRNKYDLVPCPKNGIRSQINGSNNKIDGCYKKRSDEKAINAHEIAVVLEEKLDPKFTIQNNLQAASANVQIMNDDPRRMFSFSMTIVRDQVSLWYYSRSHTAVSEPFSFVENPKMFIKVLMSFQFASEEELGFDPLVERQADGTYIFEIRQGKGPPRRFRTVRVLSEYRSNNITGRMSRIWLVREINADNLATGNEYVLKDVWLEATAATERAIQTAIFTDFEDFVKGPRSAEQEAVYTAFQNASKYKMRISDLAKDDKFKDYFMTIIADDVCGESKALAVDAKAKRGLFDTPVVSSTVASTSSKKSSQRQPSGTPRPMTAVTNHVPTQHRTYVPRQHYRVVFKELCTTVGDLETMGEVASVLEHAVTALRVMFCAGWVHRDISSGNVLAFKRVGSMQGKVSDLEYARRYPPEATYQAAADPKTGTPYFMPHEILSSSYLHHVVEVVEPSRDYVAYFSNPEPAENAPPVPVQSNTGPIFNFQHDLESIWWIFLWTATRRVSHEPSRNKFSPVFHNSISHLTNERGSCFRGTIKQMLEETLSPLLQSLSEPLEKLRSLQVTFYEERETMNELERPSSYTTIHEVFSAFFRTLTSHPQPWATTPLIAHDKDDIGSDIGQPQRVKPVRGSKKRTREEFSQAQAGPSTRGAVDAPSPKRLSRQRTAKNDMPPPSGPVTRSSTRGSSAKGNPSAKGSSSTKGSSAKTKRPAKASPVRQSSRGKSKNRA